MEQSLWMPLGIILLGVILIIIAYIGSVLPGLPGPPLAMVAIFLLPIFNLYSYNWFHITLIIILSLIVLTSLILDYALPSIITKNFGGSKYATWGSNLAILACIFISTPLGPFAIIVGPFLGAFLGELYAKKTWKVALKSATGTLIGFLAGTFGKLIVCTFIALYYLFLSCKIIFALF